MRCKPGDMAIIIADRFRENIGVTVTVLRPYIVKPKDIDPRPGWVIQSKRPLPCWLDSDPNKKKVGYFTFSAIADADLWPIRGIPITDNTTTSQSNRRTEKCS